MNNFLIISLIFIKIFNFLIKYILSYPYHLLSKLNIYIINKIKIKIFDSKKILISSFKIFHFFQKNIYNLYQIYFIKFLINFYLNFIN